MEVAGLDDTGGEFWPTTFGEPDAPTAFVPVDPRLRQVLHLLHRPLPPRPREEPHDRGHPQRGRALLRARRARGDAAGPDGRGVRPRPGANERGIQPDLGDLMRAIHDSPGLERIRFLTSYPKDMTAPDHRGGRRAAEGMRELQHPGAGRRRRRARAHAPRLHARGVSSRSSSWSASACPHAAIVTDIIVGFCGETDEEFEHTCELLERLRFDKVHVAAYSPRPGTIAHRTMTDDVPPEVKQQRLHADRADRGADLAVRSTRGTSGRGSRCSSKARETPNRSGARERASLSTWMRRRGRER